VRGLVIVCALLALPTGALAQPSPQASRSYATPLIRLPNGDYTVPMKALLGAGMNGKVMFHPQGPKTIVTVYVFGNKKHKYNFNLHRGSDCAQAGVSPIALNPAFGGQPSQTIVALPIENLASRDYVVDARNAVARSQFEEACARI
jgi:hypothetical protein